MALVVNALLSHRRVSHLSITINLRFHFSLAFAPFQCPDLIKNQIYCSPRCNLMQMSERKTNVGSVTCINDMFLGVCLIYVAAEWN